VQHALLEQSAPAVSQVVVAPHTPEDRQVVFSTPTQWLSVGLQGLPEAT
jgi:hypothetical protein